MISPDKVFEIAKKKEKQNYKFRTYLKNHAGENELDNQFLTLHNEMFPNYDCSKCRNCCKMYSAEIPESDLKSDAEYLELTTDEFIHKFLKPDKYALNYVTKHTPCDFFMDNGDCMLGNCKPQTCQKYPYTNQPDRMFCLLGFIESVSICPVAYEICERLKQMYNFK